MKILIAEDDLTSRRVLTTVLKKGGHEVVETVNGAEAGDELQKPNAPDLAIIDWVMPEMDGLEVVQRVRAMQSEHPPYIIMLTSKDEKSDIVAGLKVGANDYVTKPFDVNELCARVEVGLHMIEMQATLTSKIRELREALEDVKTLRGIVPICSHCKKIRDDKGYWHQVEVYVREHSEAEFSHSLCLGCVKELYPEEANNILDDAKDNGVEKTS